MEMNFSISPDTQAVLLLCGALGHNDRELSPITPGQYNVLAMALNALGKRPADLIGENGPCAELIAEVCRAPNKNGRVKAASPEKIAGLLRRGVTLATAMDKWASYGVSVVSRADTAYPEKLRRHLGSKAPALIYYSGNASLLTGGGMAFVGARDCSGEASEMIRSVVRGCVDLGMNVVSGGARGADQTAMQEAFSCGGKVVGVLPCDLLKACLDPSNREALAGGNALLFSTFDPELRPFSYGQVAMDRNKYIYGMADACFVAQSGIGTKSGTWSGVDEELKNKNRNPVYVYIGKTPSEGCVDLAERGAIVWDAEKTVAENLSAGAKVVCESPPEQQEFFENLLVAEESAPYGEFEKSTRAALAETQSHSTTEERSPYALFLEQMKILLTAERKETDVKKELGESLDLVPAQLRHWLEKAVRDGVVKRKERPNGRKTETVLELAN